MTGTLGNHHTDSGKMHLPWAETALFDVFSTTLLHGLFQTASIIESSRFELSRVATMV